MSTELESWKYFAQENVQEDETGTKTMGDLPGSQEMRVTFSMPLMLLQGIMGGLGFLGIVNALRALRGLLGSGLAIETLKKMGHGLDQVGLAVAVSNKEWFFLLLTVIIIKIFISCGFMGAALMLEKRVDHANWIASLICFGAIIYNMVDVGVKYMVLPDFSRYGIPEKTIETAMMLTMTTALVIFTVKLVIYLGLMTFLNNKTNNEIFAPKERITYS